MLMVDYRPGQTEALAMTPAREWLITLQIQLARAGVGFALLLGLLGSVMTFVPGYQAEWFRRRSRRSLVRDVVPNQVDARPRRSVGGLPRRTVVGRLPSGATVSRTPEPPGRNPQAPVSSLPPPALIPCVRLG